MKKRRKEGRTAREKDLRDGGKTEKEGNKQIWSKDN